MKTFKMKGTLYDNGKLHTSIRARGANGAEIMKAMCIIIYRIAERLYPDETDRNCFLYDTSTAILKMRD